MADDSSSQISDSSSDTRPNRWSGAPSTWQSLTEQERGLAASLDQIRNQDLGIHLFNSFTLRKRAREYLASKSGKTLASQEHELQGKEEESDEAGKGWAPPKSWTAWPLPPDLVPREGEHVGPEDPDDQYTFRRKEVFRSSRELEDVMVGVTLKAAKERFEKREDPPKKKAEQWHNIVDKTQETNQYENISGFEGDSTTEDTQKLHENLSNFGEDSERPEEPEPILEHPPKSPLFNLSMRPVASTDDDRSRQLLRSSVRHTLSKLDEVLMALHHARKLCTDHNSQSEPDTDNGSRERSASRGSSVSSIERRGSKGPRGRPRKFALVSRPKTAADADCDPVEEFDHPRPQRSKSTHRGRPLKHYEPLDGETQEEFEVRIARLQKKPLPASAKPREISPQPPSSPAETPAKKKRIRNPNSEERRRNRQKILGLRDWSEVLGTAALVGFPPDVIARATQRCANIFGESMEMRTMPEVPFGLKNADVVTTYQPEEIPDFTSDGTDITDNDSDDDAEEEEEEEKENDALGVHNCPVAGCMSQSPSFSNLADLRKHMNKVHALSESEIKLLLDDMSDMGGALHIDGFLRPIKRPRYYSNRKQKRARLDPEVLDDENEEKEEQPSISESEDESGSEPHAK
ncbi:RNA polymerase I-specific transcription initiation factor-domain-containing protein [Bisporella sp. PMI_857]|nr:RNA polymerase I-specific transcription initiation factor-domain-containing protein [Bisporella sp. PMI_857]